MKILRTLSPLSLVLAGSLFAACNSGGGSGGGGGPVPPDPSPQDSSVTVDVPFGTEADGVSVVTITVTVRDDLGAPLAGQRVAIWTEGVGERLIQPPGVTGADGIAVGTLSSSVAGRFTIEAFVNPGANEVRIDDEAETVFVLTPENARFVRAGGSDASTGETALEAWATLAHAASQVQPGQTVYVGAGLYPEAVEITTSGTSAAPILFRGDPQGCYTGDAGAVLVDARGAAYGLSLSGVSDVALRGFTVTGAATGSGAGTGIRVLGGSTDVQLVENDLYGNERGVAVIGSQRVVLEGNRVSNQLGATGDGIVLVGSDELSIASNLIYANPRHGIWIGSGVGSVQLELNTLYRNGGHQILEAGAGPVGEIRNSIVSEGLADGIHLAAGSGLTHTANLLWANAGFDVTTEGSGVEERVGPGADPLFQDPSGPDGLLGGAEGLDDDFRVAALSPTLDAGAGSAAATRLPFGGPLTGFGTRFDGALEGADGDGLPVNQGRHEPATWDEIPTLDREDVRVFFAKKDDARLYSRSRVEKLWPAGELAALPANRQTKWVVNAVSPLPTSEEIVAILSDDGTTTDLFVRHRDGRKWDEASPHLAITGVLPSASSDQRGFDLIYEAASGDAMLVYADGSADPRFRTLSSGAWSASAPVFGAPGPPGSDEILWVELASCPGTDEIALVYLDAGSRLIAAIWDGGAWTDSQILDTRIAELRLAQAFDAAYESLSGDLLVSYGYTTLIEETRFATRDAATGTWSILQSHSTDAVGTVFRMAADPASDRIVAGVGEVGFDDDVGGMIWDGDQWTHIAEMDPFGAPGVHDLSVAWLGSSGQAILVWRGTDGPGLDWALWANKGWKIQPDAALAGLGEPVLFEARVLPGSAPAVSLLVVDETDSLFALALSGGIWRIENGGSPLAGGIAVKAGTGVEPFHLAARR